MLARQPSLFTHSSTSGLGIGECVFEFGIMKGRAIMGSTARDIMPPELPSCPQIGAAVRRSFDWFPGVDVRLEHELDVTGQRAPICLGKLHQGHFAVAAALLR